MFFCKKSKPFLNYFNVNLVDHCNLNCKYCDHFAPLAEKKFIDIKELEKDFKRMASLVQVLSVGLMGGEPLLHPNLIEILNMSRNVLKNSRLTIFTNGILLEKQPDLFWQTCKLNNIAIGISRYPIELDFKTIFLKAIQYKVNIFLYSGTIHKPKTMYKMFIDLKGNQNPQEMSKICWQNKGTCSFLGGGKFFQCTTAGQIHRFIKYFNLDIKVSEKDYIDIYKIKSGKDICNFHNREIPFCKYCAIKEQISNLKFEISKKEITEWT